MRRPTTLLPLFLVAIFAVALTAQQPQPAADAYVREHYTKYEHRIAMRDGARLFTTVYVPKTCEAPYPSC
jgi:hypothetical protein